MAKEKDITNLLDKMSKVDQRIIPPLVVIALTSENQACSDKAIREIMEVYPDLVGAFAADNQMYLKLQEGDDEPTIGYIGNLEKGRNGKYPQTYGFDVVNKQTQRSQPARPIIFSLGDKNYIIHGPHATLD
jgi:hypothetical protein